MYDTKTDFVAQRFSNSREVFQSLTIEILKGCLAASSEIDYEYVYRENHDDAHDYNMEYVQVRHQQEAASFVAPDLPIRNPTPVNVGDASISNGEDADNLIPISRKRMNEESAEPAMKHV